MVDDTSARRTCVRCGTSYDPSIEVCAPCDVWIESGESFDSAPPLLTLDLVLAIVLPLSGPLAHFFLLSPDRRSDVEEVAGAFLWSAVYSIIGAYFVSQTHAKLKRKTMDWTRPSAFLRVYKWLSTFGLGLLAVFEATVVVAASQWRWETENRENAITLVWFAFAFYGAYVLCTLLAAMSKRQAVMEIEAREVAQGQPPEEDAT